MAKCPLCPTRISHPHNMTTHLAGNEQKGGHGVPRAKAEEMALDAFAGRYPSVNDSRTSRASRSRNG